MYQSSTGIGKVETRDIMMQPAWSEPASTESGTRWCLGLQMFRSQIWIEWKLPLKVCLHRLCYVLSLDCRTVSRFTSHRKRFVPLINHSIYGQHSMSGEQSMLWLIIVDMHCSCEICSIFLTMCMCDSVLSDSLFNSWCLKQSCNIGSSIDEIEHMVTRISLAPHRPMPII